MSFRHHIDDFMRGQIIGKIEEGRKITDVARSSTSLTAFFHGCGSHLKLMECVVDGTGEVVLEVRRLQKTDISSYQQKGTGAPQLSRWQISFLLPQESRYPENCCQTFEGRRTIRTQTCCVCPIDQTAPYCPFAMVS
ncbi:hypothetical protein TNCV_2474671 [Trichonephila clavipes]|nr:hypothetical protein TNCV_2474671 [Trichonephila clavipes]